MLLFELTPIVKHVLRGCLLTNRDVIKLIKREAELKQILSETRWF